MSCYIWFYICALLLHECWKECTKKQVSIEKWNQQFLNQKDKAFVLNVLFLNFPWHKHQPFKISLLVHITPLLTVILKKIYFIKEESIFSLKPNVSFNGTVRVQFCEDYNSITFSENMSISKQISIIKMLPINSSFCRLI